MTSLATLLDAPSGTVATTTLSGEPWSVAIVDIPAGGRGLLPQQPNCDTPTDELDGLLNGSDADAPAVRLITGGGAELLPVRPASIDDENQEIAAWERMRAALGPLPVGSVIDASPTKLRGLHDVMILTRISEDAWAPLEWGPAPIDQAKAYLASPDGPHDWWVKATIAEISDLDFTIHDVRGAWQEQPATA